MFPDIAYLEWIDGRPEAATYDLGSSDLRRESADAREVVPPVLANVPAPDANVEELLADAYGVEPENVLVTAGATHANFLAVAAALSNAGSAADAADAANADDGEDGDATTDRVLVEKPGYEPLLATPAGLGATVDRFRRPAEADYRLDADRVAAAVVEDTALVTVTNRHNPSGRHAGRDELAAVAEVAVDADVRLLVDEVYAPFRTDPDDGPFGGTTAAGLPNTVVTNSLTKFFGFGPVRLGWLIADAEFVERARSVAYHVPAVAVPSRRLAARALADETELAAGSRERIRANHDALATFVSARDDLTGRVEQGCTYAFLEHESADGTELAQAAWERDVLVVPGRFFDDPGRFRISAGHEPEATRAALDRFGEVLDELGD